MIRKYPAPLCKNNYSFLSCPLILLPGIHLGQDPAWLPKQSECKEKHTEGKQ